MKQFYKELTDILIQDGEDPKVVKFFFNHPEFTDIQAHVSSYLKQLGIEK